MTSTDARPTPANALDGLDDLAALAGLDAADVDAIAKVGDAAMASSRFALALKVYDALVALEPHDALHRLRRAAAHHAVADVKAALADLDAVVAAASDKNGGAGVERNDAAIVHALLLRAELRAKDDHEGARADLGRARALASSSPAAKAALEAGGAG